MFINVDFSYLDMITGWYQPVGGFYYDLLGTVPPTINSA